MNFAEVGEQIYISLGSDCAVAHNLRSLNLLNTAFPFDWTKCDKINMICDTLEQSFSNFFENFTEFEQSDNYNNFDNFDNFDNIDNIDNSIKSRIKIKLSNGII